MAQSTRDRLSALEQSPLVRYVQETTGAHLDHYTGKGPFHYLPHRDRWIEWDYPRGQRLPSNSFKPSDHFTPTQINELGSSVNWGTTYTTADMSPMTFISPRAGLLVSMYVEVYITAPATRDIINGIFNGDWNVKRFVERCDLLSGPTLVETTYSDVSLTKTSRRSGHPTAVRSWSRGTSAANNFKSWVSNSSSSLNEEGVMYLPLELSVFATMHNCLHTNHVDQLSLRLSPRALHTASVAFQPDVGTLRYRVFGLYRDYIHTTESMLREHHIGKEYMGYDVFRETDVTVSADSRTLTCNLQCRGVIKAIYLFYAADEPLVSIGNFQHYTTNTHDHAAITLSTPSEVLFEADNSHEATLRSLSVQSTAMGISKCFSPSKTPFSQQLGTDWDVESTYTAIYFTDVDRDDVFVGGLPASMFPRLTLTVVTRADGFDIHATGNRVFCEYYTTNVINENGRIHRVLDV